MGAVGGVDPGKRGVLGWGGAEGRPEGASLGRNRSQGREESQDRTQGEGGTGRGKGDKGHSEIKTAFWEEAEWWNVRGAG